MYTQTMLSVLCCVLLADPRPVEINDLKKLEGSWLVVSVETNGEKRPAKDDESLWTVKGNKLSSKLRGKPSTGGLVRLGPEDNPKAFDITVEDSKKPIVGIYKFADDETLWLALSQDATRPAEFGTKRVKFPEPGSHRLLVMKRQKP